MSPFNQLASESLAVHQQMFGDPNTTVSYLASDRGAWVNLSGVIIHPETTINRRGTQGWNRIRIKPIVCQPTTFTKRPAINSRIRIADSSTSNEYIIIDVEQVQSGRWHINLQQSVPNEITRPKYRRP